MPAALIILLTLAAYANAWPNNLILDDKLFEGSERFRSWSNLPGYFTENAWASEGFVTRLYRPMLLVTITLDAHLYGDWVAGFHLTNIFLHVLVSLLLYGFLLLLLRRTDGDSQTAALYALLAALLYAVHPVHTEAVNSIFNRSEILVALTGLAGLSWLLRYEGTKPFTAWAGLSIAYLLALFSKESAIVLPGLAVLIVFLTTPGNVWLRVKQCLPALCLLVPLAVYLVLRLQALDSGGGTQPPGIDSDIAATELGTRLDLSLWPTPHRLLLGAGVWYQALAVLFWPFPLHVSYPAPPVPQQYLGLVIHLALVTLALFQAGRKRYALLLGLVFFHMALLPATRIIGDISDPPHLYERYLYFASVGIFVAFAFGLRVLGHRFGTVVSVAATALVLVALAPATWSRNLDWADEIRLFGSDYEKGNHSKFILRLLTSAYLENSNYQAVAELCERHRDVMGTSAKLSIHCGVALSRLGRNEEAVQAYTYATTAVSTRTVAHENLAKLFIRQGNLSEARTHLEWAVKTETDPAMKAFRQGYMLAQLYPRNRGQLSKAKSHFERALQIQPTLLVAREWLARVDERLESR